MLVELAVVPLGGDAHLSDEIANVVRLVHESGLAYQLTPSGTCIEGEWDEVMTLVRRCHERVRQDSPHVITTLKIEDQQGASDQLRQNIAAVEKKLGQPAQRLPQA